MGNQPQNGGGSRSPKHVSKKSQHRTSPQSSQPLNETNNSASPSSNNNNSNNNKSTDNQSPQMNQSVKRPVSDKSPLSNNSTNNTTTNTTNPLTTTTNTTPTTTTTTTTTNDSPKPETKHQTNESQELDPAQQQNFVPLQAGLTNVETNSPFYFPGYCGYLERVEAEQLIQFKPAGTFLIRWSDNKRFYVISYLDEQQKVQHMGNIEIGMDKRTTRVTKGNQRQFFPSMNAYIAFLRSKKMIDGSFEASAYVDGNQYKEAIKSGKKTEYENFDD